MSTDRQKLTKGLKYVLGAFPFLVIGPILITMGFKAIKLNGNFLWLILGIITATLAIILGFMGIKIILNAFFNSK